MPAKICRLHVHKNTRAHTHIQTHTTRHFPTAYVWIFFSFVPSCFSCSPYLHNISISNPCIDARYCQRTQLLPPFHMYARVAAYIYVCWAHIHDMDVQRWFALLWMDISCPQLWYKQEEWKRALLVILMPSAKISYCFDVVLKTHAHRNLL